MLDVRQTEAIPRVLVKCLYAEAQAHYDGHCSSVVNETRSYGVGAGLAEEDVVAAAGDIVFDRFEQQAVVMEEEGAEGDGAATEAERSEALREASTDSAAALDSQTDEEMIEAARSYMLPLHLHVDEELRLEMATKILKRMRVHMEEEAAARS